MKYKYFNSKFYLDAISYFNLQRCVIYDLNLFAVNLVAKYLVTIIFEFIFNTIRIHLSLTLYLITYFNYHIIFFVLWNVSRLWHFIRSKLNRRNLDKCIVLTVYFLFHIILWARRGIYWFYDNECIF